jgi:hypothetical protein
MKERPILFSAPMVLALLDGSKTMTRRIITPQPRLAPLPELTGPWSWWNGRLGKKTSRSVNLHDDASSFAAAMVQHCPYGAVGDRLWVKEACALVNDGSPDPFLVYRADRGARNLSGQRGGITYWMASDYEPERWRPSIHMPRWASRITLEITDVRVQRLQEISEDDAKAEGVEFDVWDQALVARDYSTPDSWLQTWSDRMTRYVRIEQLARASYCTLWESINGAGSWALNSWVFAISFQRVAP